MEEREDGEDDCDPWIRLARHPIRRFDPYVVRFATRPLESPLVVEPQPQDNLSPFPPQLYSSHLPPLPLPKDLDFQPHHHTQQPSPFIPSASDVPSRPHSSGFNPALLNPIQPSEQSFLVPFLRRHFLHMSTLRTHLFPNHTHNILTSLQVRTQNSC